MTTYKGTAPETVTAEGVPLDPRTDLLNHSPCGFAWGYGGSGPSQLALAILADHFGEEFAMEHHQRFKTDLLEGIPRHKDWLFDSALLDQWAVENELIEPPPPATVEEIVESLYAASQALKIAGQKMGARIEADAREAGRESSQHPHSKELARLIVCTGHVERVIESLDVQLADTARCGSCNELIQGDHIPYRLNIEGEWQTVDICRGCFDRFKGEAF